jgi:hypothetical protein
MDSARIFDIVQQFLQLDGWATEIVTEGETIATSAAGENGEWACLAQIYERGGIFVFYSICPLKVPEDRRPAMAEFITRANHDLLMGNLEMDYATGEIRCKTSINTYDETLTPLLVRHVVHPNAITMDRYLPGIKAILEEGISPAEAIARAESA